MPSVDAAAPHLDRLLRSLRLPDDWRDRPRWRILEFGAPDRLNFLRIWQAWRCDPHRPRTLHYVAIEPFAARADAAPGPIDDANGSEALAPLAEQLDARSWGLTPGFHRLGFEEGRVLLTLCLGNAMAMLREQRFEADSVWLGQASRDPGPWVSWDLHAARALARCCRRGAQVAGDGVPFDLRGLLLRSGFVVQKPFRPRAPREPVSSAFDNAFAASFDPAWAPKARMSDPLAPAGASAEQADLARPRQAVVIGAGIAGASVAASLARRGLRVTVLDSSEAPASGASSLPAGLFAPHVSADDGLLSRLTRAGVRTTIEFAQQRLREGVDWQQTGVLELRRGAGHALVMSGRSVFHDWSEPAAANRKASAGVADSAPALWHHRAGWIKPVALVQALLDDARIEFRGGFHVVCLQPGASGWSALDAQGALLAKAPLMVIAAGYESGALTPVELPLQPVRGQLSVGSPPPVAHPGGMPMWPPFPVNGHGSFASNIPCESGPVWIAGASYQRDLTRLEISPDDHAENFGRVATLLADVATYLAPCFECGDVRGWAGVRCATPDRLPVVGPLAAISRPGLWISSGMGSRGLSFALLCAELLAARVCGEPLPMPARLARALDPARFG